MGRKRKDAITQKTAQTLIVSGQEYDVTGEDGKYIYCGDTKFRRSRKDIAFSVRNEHPKEAQEELDECAEDCDDGE